MRKLIKKICPKCGKEFFNIERVKYCSHKCSSSGKNNGMFNKHHTDESRLKQSLSKIGKPGTNKDKIFSKEHCLNISLAKKGKFRQRKTYATQPGEKLFCEWCGKEIFNRRRNARFTKNGISHTYKHHFCDSKCQMLFFHKNGLRDMRGEKNHNFKKIDKEKFVELYVKLLGTVFIETVT